MWHRERDERRESEVKKKRKRGTGKTGETRTEREKRRRIRFLPSFVGHRLVFTPLSHTYMQKETHTDTRKSTG